MALIEKLTAIADAIREASNSTDRMTLAEMPERILALARKVVPITMQRGNQFNTAYKTETYNSAGSITVGTEYLTAKSRANAVWSAGVRFQADLTDYSTVSMTISWSQASSSFNQGYALWLSPTKTTAYADGIRGIRNIAVSNMQTITVTLDVRDIVGTYYVQVGAATGSWSNQRTAYIYSVVLS